MFLVQQIVVPATTDPTSQPNDHRTTHTQGEVGEEGEQAFLVQHDVIPDTTDPTSQTNKTTQQNKNDRKKTRDHITFASWNCRHGILTRTNEPNEKIIEMENYMNQHEVDVMIVNKADLHGPNSRILRTNPIDEDTLKLNLHLENYNFWLPNQWEAHGQARTIMYTKENLNVQKVKIEAKFNDTRCQPARNKESTCLWSL